MEMKGNLSCWRLTTPPPPRTPVFWAQRNFLHASECDVTHFTRVAALPAFFPLAVYLRDASDDFISSCLLYSSGVIQSQFPLQPTASPNTSKHSWPLPRPLESWSSVISLLPLNWWVWDLLAHPWLPSKAEGWITPPRIVQGVRAQSQGNEQKKARRQGGREMNSSGCFRHLWLRW